MGDLTTKQENDWQDRATKEAIAAARRIVLGDAAVIPMMTPISRLSDVEWGWIVAAVIFGWVRTRSEQATSEHLKAAIRAAVDVAWDDGAIAAILPELAETPGIDWTKPLADWSRDDIVRFLSIALSLAQLGLNARDATDAVSDQSADVVLAG